jgi:hypothetical protein
MVSADAAPVTHAAAIAETPSVQPKRERNRKIELPNRPDLESSRGAAGSGSVQVEPDGPTPRPESWIAKLASTLHAAKAPI